LARKAEVAAGVLYRHQHAIALRQAGRHGVHELKGTAVGSDGLPGRGDVAQAVEHQQAGAGLCGGRVDQHACSYALGGQCLHHQRRHAW
jgi:hypothetical protein